MSTRKPTTVVRIGALAAGLLAGTLALAGPAAAAPGAAAAETTGASTLRVAPAPISATFNVVADFTRFGQNVFVVGSIPALGSWDVTKAVPLWTDGSTFPSWRGGAALPANTYVEYQYIVKNPDGSVARWEKGYQQNRTTITPPTGTYITHHTFGGY